MITNDANSGSFVEASFVSRKDRAQRMIFAPTVLGYGLTEPVDAWVEAGFELVTRTLENSWLREIS